MRDLLDKLSAIEQQNDSNLPEVGDDFGISLGEDFEIETTIVGFTEDGIVVELDDTAQNILESQGVKFSQGYLEEGLRDPKDNPCWKGYKPVGTKKKNGKTVPNCVPNESVTEEQGYDEVSPKSASYILRKLEQDVPMSDILDDFPELGRMMEIIAGEHGLHPDDDFEEIEDILRNDLEDIAAQEDDFGDYDQDEEDVREAEYQGKNVPLGKKLPGDVKKYKVYVRKPNGNIVKVNFGDKKMRIKKSNPARRKSFRARHNCSNPGPRHKARYWSCRNW